MNNFCIFEVEGFLDDLKDVTGSQWERVYQKVKDQVYPQLTKQPYYGPNIKKLQGYNPATRRYRVGDLRLFYEIDGKARIVLMTAAYSRKDAYRK